MQKLTAAILLFHCALASIAQPYEIRGRITDNQNGYPLPGATVTIKGSTFSTVAGNTWYFKQ
jgi:hypothetical protein